MERINDVTVTGIYRTEQVSATFTKQILEINSKDRDGQWKPAQLDIYIKDDLKASSAIQEGMEAKLKGWIAFNFATGGRSFPKVIVTEVLEVAQPQYQNNQAAQSPQAGIPPVPGAAPHAPMQAPQMVQPLPAGVQPAPMAAPTGMPAMPTPPMG